MAFDNEQKGQKNYLDHGYNTVVYHTVTSFVLFNYNSNDQIQNQDPWLHKTSLNTLQIQELFDLTPEMQILIDRQLHYYLSIIITEACTEKSQNVNAIDNLVANQNTKIGNQKWCQGCGKGEIENLRRKCPQCKMKLPTVVKIQEVINQTISEKEDMIKPLIIRPYQFKTNISENLINPISITQRSESQKDINIPNILVPDPLRINPNSIKNVQKVLDYIKEISGINKGK